MPAVATAAGLPSRLGKYELLMPLAAGGMARIYIGRSTGIGSFERHVVLKMITPERANDLTAVNMFLDEARLAASLNHQNVAQVFEVGEDAGIHYLAMEYVHGQDLRAVLAKAGSQGTRIPLELALTVVAGAAAGLHHAHERRGPDGVPLGIVHRDVSPSNIMIGYDGAVKLLDFGIAKASARSVETQSGIIKGKFAYMAPEQCRGREVDRRSDVFSLGIILYEVSTQHRCFRADSDFDTMHRIVTGDVVRPTRLVQGYPQALEAIVMKALAVDPAQRYQSAGLLLEAIESFAVSARMSLSTMGLGRFMRDMFGEVQEPWLNTAATKVLQPIAAKENTISSTDGKGSASQPAMTLDPADGIPDEDARFPDSAKAEAAKTLLDLPREHHHEVPEQAEWDDKAYPSPQPAMARGDKLLIEPPLRAPLPLRAVTAAPSTPEAAPVMLPPDLIQPAQAGMPPIAQGTNPLPHPELPLPPPPQAQFNVPGSGSAPAHPAVAMVGTKHGYASGAMTRGDVSYPRYELPPDAIAPDVQLRPNRRPLFIGLGIVAAGLIGILFVSFGGSSDEPPAARAGEPAEQTAETTETATAATPEQTAAQTAQPTGSADDSVDDNMVSVVIHSDPAGADVLIAGTKIGVTPFESKLKRGTKIAPLAVQKEGYAPWNGKIDLSGEYENRNIKLPRLEDMPKPDENATVPATKSPADHVSPTGADSGTSAQGATATLGQGTGGGKAKSMLARPADKKTGTTSVKTGTKATSGTGAAAKREKKDEKCQPPGPNVDPFGPPVCKV